MLVYDCANFGSNITVFSSYDLQVTTNLNSLVPAGVWTKNVYAMGIMFQSEMIHTQLGLLGSQLQKSCLWPEKKTNKDPYQ